MVDFDSKVVDVSLIGKDEKEGIICITETELHRLFLTFKGNIIKRKTLSLTGKAISMRISKLSWSNVLVLTH